MLEFRRFQVSLDDTGLANKQKRTQREHASHLTCMMSPTIVPASASHSRHHGPQSGEKAMVFRHPQLAKNTLAINKRLIILLTFDQYHIPGCPAIAILTVCNNQSGRICVLELKKRDHVLESFSIQPSLTPPYFFPHTRSSGAQ